MAIGDDILAELQKSSGLMANFIQDSKAGLALIASELATLTGVVSQQLSAARASMTAVPASIGGNRSEANMIPHLISEAFSGNIESLIKRLGPSGETTNAWIDAARSVLGAAGALRSGAEQQMSVNRVIAAFSPQTMMANLQADLHSVFRQFETSFALAPSAVSLTQSVDRMRDAWLGFDIFAAKQQNELARAGADISTIIGSELSGVVAGLGDGIRSMFGAGGAIQGALEGMLASLDPAVAGGLGSIIAGIPFLGEAARGGLAAKIQEWLNALRQPADRPFVDPAAVTLFGMALRELQPRWRRPR